jgi:hypothetical protein
MTWPLTSQRSRTAIMKDKQCEIVRDESIIAIGVKRSNLYRMLKDAAQFLVLLGREESETNSDDVA